MRIQTLQILSHFPLIWPWLEIVPLRARGEASQHLLLCHCGDAASSTQSQVKDRKRQREQEVVPTHDYHSNPARPISSPQGLGRQSGCCYISGETESWSAVKVASPTGHALNINTKGILKVKESLQTPAFRGRHFNKYFNTHACTQNNSDVQETLPNIMKPRGVLIFNTNKQEPKKLTQWQTVHRDALCLSVRVTTISRGNRQNKTSAKLHFMTCLEWTRENRCSTWITQLAGLPRLVKSPL